MSQTVIRSLSELERLARERLAAGDIPGQAQALLAVDGEDLVTVETWLKVKGGADTHTVCRVNSQNVPHRVAELLVGAYGATLLRPATVL